MQITCIYDINGGGFQDEPDKVCLPMSHRIKQNPGVSGNIRVGYLTETMMNHLRNSDERPLSVNRPKHVSQTASLTMYWCFYSKHCNCVALGKMRESLKQKDSVNRILQQSVLFHYPISVRARRSRKDINVSTTLIIRLIMPWHLYQSTLCLENKLVFAVMAVILSFCDT